MTSIITIRAVFAALVGCAAIFTMMILGTSAANSVRTPASVTAQSSAGTNGWG
ncbi:MAG: hypothetical protein ACM3ML_18270 [Micromonosporaceae bacterium]